MSKIGKLFKSPGRFFADAMRNKSSPAKVPAPVKKVAAAPVKKAKQAVVKAKPAVKKAAPKKVVVSPAVAARKSFFEGLTSFLTNMMLDGDYDTLKRAWAHAFSDVQGPTEAIGLLSVRAEAEMATGDHSALAETAARISSEYKSPIGHFYLAQSYFVRGMYTEAKQELLVLLHERPAHAAGVYLLCEIADRTGEFDMAWRALERLAKVSKRPKTWHVMSGLVYDSADMLRLLGNWEEWKKSPVGLPYHKDVSEFVALGALRCENYELAKSIWRKSLNSALRSTKGFRSMVVRKPSYSSRRAEKALSDINRVLNNAEIEMFLVSGTLLGCVREGRLLGHDKDIDVGIWDSVDADVLNTALTESGLFYILKSRSNEIVRLRHVNGIAIDVFYHFREKEDYWHGGVKMVWHNTPFKLVDRDFLNETYLIPEDYDLYLTENYGDWRTPKIDFDSAFDTPNGEAANDGEMAIHSYKGLMDSCIDSNWSKVSFYLSRLENFGEGIFVENFKSELEKKLKIELPKMIEPEPEIVQEESAPLSV